MDEIDSTLLRTEVLESARIAAFSAIVSNMPAGVPGECELCGEHNARIVRGACSRCRDRNGLP